MSAATDTGRIARTPARILRTLRDSDYFRYVVRRILWAVVVILAVALTVFALSRLTSDPARTMLPPEATHEQYLKLKDSLGLDGSIIDQLEIYVGNVATLDFGRSFWLDAPVSDLIMRRLPYTLVLVGIGMAIAVIGGVLVGVAASLRPGSIADQTLAGFSLVGVSIPQFWLGEMLILLFAVTFHLFPTSGGGSPRHLVLPAITLALPALGRIAQITRATMIDELATQHIRVARAKGLGGGYILRRHALRNVLVPVLTICAYELQVALAGQVIVVETVFGLPGIGYLTIQAIQRQDLVLVQGIVLTLALLIVMINLVTDLLYKVIDPRIDFG